MFALGLGGSAIVLLLHSGPQVDGPIAIVWPGQDSLGESGSSIECSH